MKIAGYIKNSFVDYPNNISAVVFTPGCNMNCWYCHNRDILSESHPDYSEADVISHLNKRKGLISGVVISGGEPLLQPGLEDFIVKVKDLSYKVKLDTNGLMPHKLKELLNKNLLDYIAMDVKAPFDKYSEITQTDIDTDVLLECITLIKQSKLPYEFRTTFAPTLSQQDIIQIAGIIAPYEVYYIQQYRPVKPYKNFIPVKVPPHSNEYLLETVAKVNNLYGNCFSRGI